MVPFKVNHMPHLRTKEIIIAGQDFHLRLIPNGIGGIGQSTMGQITCVNTSFAIISTLDVKPIPWDSSQPLD